MLLAEEEKQQVQNGKKLLDKFMHDGYNKITHVALHMFF